MTRCSWCNEDNELYIEYHDKEWGVPRFDDPYLFEMLLLESFQAGLSWECILNKREHFREAFDHFDWKRIQNYDDTKIDQLCSNPDIIRHRLKIQVTIQNAQIFERIVEEYGSFFRYLRSFWDGHTIYECHLSKSALSDAISKDLEKRGMKFVGSITIYSYLQAIGIIHSHQLDCCCYSKPLPKP